MRAVAAVLGFGLALAAQAQGVPDGQVALATHRSGQTFVYVTALSKLEPGLRNRLLQSATPEPLPPEEGWTTRTVVSPLQPLGTPFASWSGRALQGYDGAAPVCSRSVGRLVLLGSVEGAADPSDAAMHRALEEGIVAGQIDDRAQACKGAQLFHDPDLGPLRIAPSTEVTAATPEGRDEIFGGIGRLRLQPEWVLAQKAFLARQKPAAGSRSASSVDEPGPASAADQPGPASSTSEPRPPNSTEEAAPAAVSWDGAGAQAVRFALGSSPYVAAVSVSPGCTHAVARLFHAMNQPILIWPSLLLDSPHGSLPRWVADAGELWPVVSLDGALLSAEGDHYAVVQRFPGTPAPTCRP